MHFSMEKITFFRITAFSENVGKFFFKRFDLVPFRNKAQIKQLLMRYSLFQHGFSYIWFDIFLKDIKVLFGQYLHKFSNYFKVFHAIQIGFFALNLMSIMIFLPISRLRYYTTKCFCIFQLVDIVHRIYSNIKY